MLRVFGLASVGGFSEQKAVGAILGVGGGLVFDVGHGARLAVAAEQLYHAVAILAPELRIAVGESDGDRLDLPERLVASPFFDATTFDFTIVDFFTFRFHYFPLPPPLLPSSFSLGVPPPTR